MTEEQEKRLQALSGAIRSRSGSGGTAQKLRQLRLELQGVDTNLKCSTCVGEMLDYLNNKLIEYESRPTNAI